jgi:3-oxoacyl-[acyl-carrier-protein] synthase-3
VLFGDGAGAIIYGATDREDQGILSTTAGADGNFAKELWLELPASRYLPRITKEGFDEGRHFPRMNGREVFKTAVRRFPETVQDALRAAGKTVEDVDLFIPHQANLRISEAVQKALGLADSKVYNNIDRLGNTTAASIPIALDECIKSGRLQRGQLVVAAAFGAGFTWGATVIRY